MFKITRKREVSMSRAIGAGLILLLTLGFCGVLEGVAFGPE